MQIPPELMNPNKREMQMPGLGQHHYLERHDPSNIIRVDGLHYVWYTEHPPEDGFIGTYVDLATSTDGVAWEYQGRALEAGSPGDWDSKGALTAYVVPRDGRYVMFYTGVGDTYEQADRDRRGIGYAVAGSPYGPWKKHPKPILWPGVDGEWDELCCDDTNVIFRGGKWWLYYKGRRIGSKGSDAMIGVAVSDSLTGPYEKHPANPLFPGHAFSAWVHRDGVAAIEGKIRPRTERRVLWSEDGIRFVPAGPFDNQSTGLYCPANFGNGVNPWGVSWGIDVWPEAAPRYLMRFEVDLRPADAPAGPPPDVVTGATPASAREPDA